MGQKIKDKKILITGGAGFIGSHLTDRLLDIKAKVTVVDNLITGSRQNLVQAEKQPGFRFIQADAAKPVKSYANEKFEYIFHLASPASPVGYMDNPVKTYQVNAFGTNYLFEYAIKTKARFLFASTSEVYGDPLEHPQKESYWGNVNPIGIRACYDESKRFGEMVITTLGRQFNYLNYTIVRIFNTYGPRMTADDQRVMPNLITQALRNKPMTVYGQGKQTRSFCYVSDLVEYILRAGIIDQTKGKVINIGKADEWAMINLAKKIKQLTQTKSKIVFKPQPEDDPQKRRPDISQAIKLLKYRPKVDLEKGLIKTIEYFKKSL